MEAVFSNISTLQVLLGCIILFALLSPIAILSTRKQIRMKSDYFDGLVKDGYEAISDKSELIIKINKLPNFSETLNINVSEIYRKKIDGNLIYQFLHHESNTEGYSRDLRCILIESKIAGLLPKLAFQPIKIKNKLTMNLDKWKAPIISFSGSQLKSFKVRSENQEWLENIINKSLVSVIEDKCMRLGLAVEGNDNILVGYLIGNQFEPSITENATATCMSILSEIIKESSIKYRGKKEYA